VMPGMVPVIVVVTKPYYFPPMVLTNSIVVPEEIRPLVEALKSRLRPDSIWLFGSGRVATTVLTAIGTSWLRCRMMPIPLCSTPCSPGKFSVRQEYQRRLSRQHPVPWRTVGVRRIRSAMISPGTADCCMAEAFTQPRFACRADPLSIAISPTWGHQGGDSRRNISASSCMDGPSCARGILAFRRVIGSGHVFGL
jgi:hypothetical protein